MARLHSLTNKIVLALVSAAGLVPSWAAPPPAEVSHTRRVPVLNRVTFHSNVRSKEAVVEHWFVMYCVEWFRPCQGIRETYYEKARSYERQINGDALLKLPVRFAEVDCAVDKVLCNEQQVEMYPHVVHYHRGEKVASWEFDGERIKAGVRKMAEFLEEQTGFFSVPSGAEVLGQRSPSSGASLPIVSLQHFAAMAFQLGPLVVAKLTRSVRTFTAGGARALWHFQELSQPSSDGEIACSLQDVFGACGDDDDAPLGAELENSAAGEHSGPPHQGAGTDPSINNTVQGPSSQPAVVGQ